MSRTYRSLTTITLAAVLTALVAGGALAQQSKGGGKIVCWKDKSGKTIGCGDKVPPEYLDYGTRELDKRGITRRTTETAEERAKREADEKQQAAQKAEENKRIAEQKRQDTALINTFSNEKEIDLKRDRDLQVVDSQLTQMRVAHKSSAARHAEAKGRVDETTKSGKPATDAQKEDLARAEAAMAKAEQSIAAKEKEKDEIRQKYAAMRERYIVLRGGPAPAAPTAAAKK